MAKQVILYTDGGSRGNPGPGGAGFVISTPAGCPILARGVFLGQTTNNVAEYTAVREGLAAAKEMQAQSVRLFSDSQLLVRQLNGQYRVKSPNLKDIYADCIKLLASFASWQVTHIYREKNTEADAMANQAMDKKGNVETRHTSSSKSESEKLRIGILLSGGGRTMTNIQKEIEDGCLNAEIVVVISSLSNVRGVQLAQGLGFNPVIIRKKDNPDVEQFSEKIAKTLDEAQVDLVVQAGWMCLWHIPANYQNRVMNIHPALLPAFGGQGMYGHHVHEAVVKTGCKVSGCTVHFCTNEYDAGPIIVQRTCEVRDDDDADTLAARVFEQERLAYPEAIKLFAEGRLKVQNGIVLKQA
ncbi:MAG: phosphoribosylglycinamide formyltransferase [Planctomycetota bacterium]|nr:MAG: phosphoribosylglycinamide formyltransferase [Planctomycetota bacterium]